MAENEAQTQEVQEDNDKVVEITATTPVGNTPFPDEAANEDGRVEGTFLFTVGESLQEDIEMFGEETVRNFWLRQATVKGQSDIRRELQNGTPPEDIGEVFATWRPDVTHAAKKDPKASIMSDFRKLPKGEREAILNALEEQAGG